MATYEHKTHQAYLAAYRAYDLSPNYVTARRELYRLAFLLVKISDHYQPLLDEADDILAEI